MAFSPTLCSSFLVAAFALSACERKDDPVADSGNDARSQTRAAQSGTRAMKDQFAWYLDSVNVPTFPIDPSYVAQYKSEGWLIRSSQFPWTCNVRFNDSRERSMLVSFVNGQGKIFKWYSVQPYKEVPYSTRKLTFRVDQISVVKDSVAVHINLTEDKNDSTGVNMETLSKMLSASSRILRTSPEDFEVRFAPPSGSSEY